MKITITNQLVTSSPYRGFAVIAIPEDPCLKDPLDAAIDRTLYMTLTHQAVMQMFVLFDFPKTMKGEDKAPMVETMKNLTRSLRDMGLPAHYVWSSRPISKTSNKLFFELFILVATNDMRTCRAVINKVNRYWAKAIGIRDTTELVQARALGKGYILRRDTPEFLPALRELVTETSCMFLADEMSPANTELVASVLPATDKAMVQSLDLNADGSVKIGPNGHPVGYAKNCDRVEWVPDEERPGKRWPLILRRNDKAILKAYEELRDKTWWLCHQRRMEQISCGAIKPSEAQMVHIRKGVQAAKKIEKKYGRDNLLNDPHNELLHGRVSALAWVLGTDWESSGDL